MMQQPFLAALLGTSVEYFETVAIAYAIIRAGYPREAISATVVGHVLVFIAAIYIWPVHELVPVFWFRFVAAFMLTLMGLYWTVKSIRRLMAGRRPRWVDDPLGKVGVSSAPHVALFSLLVFFIMLKSSVIEAFEILLVVFPIAASQSTWTPVLAGAASGIVGVTVLAVILHGQLKKVPEVRLKLVTGVVLALIGGSWLIELLG
ncbi:MAG TPA: hypothetical protein DDZ88_15515 [Verrucomicrobiales bacterium]|nr:hypothetical protein [Verrucomicrobiales bacterium]